MASSNDLGGEKMKFTEEEIKKLTEKLVDNKAYITARIGKDGAFECICAGTIETVLQALISSAAQLFLNAENDENHAEITEMINAIPCMIKLEMTKIRIKQIFQCLADSSDDPEDEE